LQTVQEAAKTQGFLFPLSLGAQGSCQIGGNLATNAGGTNVLRYGNARELCLGLEVVTAQGEILHGLRSLRKDNTGFDLRDLYIGSEGCLGIITAAVMKLYPLPVTQWTALVAVPNIPATIELLSLFQKRTAALLTGFEMMSKDSLDLTAKQFPHMKNPLANDPFYTVLVELSDHEGEEHARNLMEQVLEAAFEAGIANDAVIASNLSQAQSFWTMREHITMAQAQEGANLKHDISLPISELDAFIRETDQLIREQFAGVRIINFGHLGDGNLHYNIAPPLGVNASEFNRVHEEAIHDVVYSQVEKHHGSISAEHGIGQLKLPDLEAHRGSVAHQLMRSIKTALDPKNIMNPGKVLP
jgi:FAD/FMN-containing dehydrogenase